MFCIKSEQYIILNFPISEVKYYLILPTRHSVVIVSIFFNTVFLLSGFICALNSIDHLNFIFYELHVSIIFFFCWVV